jgi:NTP pyrophosphatase (non-canonical NTP hydrolase)
MEFSEYSEVALKTANYPKRGQFVGLLYVALGLTGEAGELANKIKKIMRDDGFDVTAATRYALLEELGDCLWYIDRAADELGSSLEEVAIMNNKKLMSRLERGKIGGSGDHR